MRKLGALLWPLHLYQHTHKTLTNTYTHTAHVYATHIQHSTHTYTHTDVVWWCVPVYNPSTWKVEDRGLGVQSS